MLPRIGTTILQGIIRVGATNGGTTPIVTPAASVHTSTPTAAVSHWFVTGLSLVPPAPVNPAAAASHWFITGTAHT